MQHNAVLTHPDGKSAEGITTNASPASIRHGGYRPAFPATGGGFEDLGEDRPGFVIFSPKMV
jgi:hypothetical protein